MKLKGYNKFRQPRPPRRSYAASLTRCRRKDSPPAQRSPKQPRSCKFGSIRKAQLHCTYPTLLFSQQKSVASGWIAVRRELLFSFKHIDQPSPLLDITRITVLRSPLSAHSATYYETPGRVGSAEYGRPLAGGLLGSFRSYSRPKDAHPLLSILMGAVAVLRAPGAEPECLRVALETPFLIKNAKRA